MASAARHRLDLAGVLLATLGLLGVVYGLIEGKRYGWGSVVGPLTIPAIIAAGVLVLVAFVCVPAASPPRQSARSRLSLDLI